MWQNLHSVWSDDKVQALRLLWSEDLSASTIAARLGVTRNAVLGKAHRLGLASRESGPQPRFIAGKSRRAFGWNPELRARLAALAAAGVPADAIATELGTTRGSVVTYAGRQKIGIVLYGEEEQAQRDELTRTRDRAKDQKRSKKKARPGRAILSNGLNVSKTSAEYRRRFLADHSITKGQLQRMLAEAVRNTAGMPV